MSSSTGDMTIQNKYHNSDVTMAIAQSQPIPKKEGDPGEAILTNTTTHCYTSINLTL